MRSVPIKELRPSGQVTAYFLMWLDAVRAGDRVQARQNLAALEGLGVRVRLVRTAALAERLAVEGAGRRADPNENIGASR
jgi:hypothetical protein